MKLKTSTALAALLLAGLALTGCQHDTATYQLTLTNLTSNQPMSPLAVIVHDKHYAAWQTGTEASDGLEWLAEGGDPTMLLAMAEQDALSTMTGNAVPPGGSDEIMFDVKGPDIRTSHLTVATMLVNTNDGFTGTNGLALGRIKMHQSVTLLVPALDAGTEANDELAATVPGPAGGGEGYNVARNDVNIITGHAGVISQQDGLAMSTLDGSHRFDNPVARLVVTRIK